MSTPLARQLEATFSAACGDAIDPGVSIRHSQEDQSGEPLPLPAVVLAAVEKGQNLSIRVAGRAASDLELRAACRVTGIGADSALAAETLAAAAKAAIEGATITGGWLFLQLFPQDDERAFEGNTRVLTRVWKVVALASL